MDNLVGGCLTQGKGAGEQEGCSRGRQSEAVCNAVLKRKRQMFACCRRGNR